MYIPNDHWDKIVSVALNLIETPDVAASDPLFNLIHHIINLEDAPVPRKKRAPKKGFQKIKQQREYMREFMKYFITRLASDRINKLKKRKRKSTDCIKHT